MPPAEVSVARFHVAGEEYVVFRFPHEEAHLTSLSPAEREVARAVMEGKSNLAIARARGVSERTVANQVASIFRKLGVGSRLELANLHAQGVGSTKR
jgi:DNA-binding NarL/FixJ family response regulator